MSEQRTQLSGSARALPSDARRVGAPDPAEQIEVTVTLRGPDLPGTAPVAAVDPAAFAARYGASQADADRVEQQLSALGLRVYDVSLPGRSLHAQGTPAQLTAAFGAQLDVYDSAEHGRFRGREGDLEVPAPLAGIVTGVFGLDDRRVARRRAGATATAPLLPDALTPAAIEQRYSFPRGDGAGQKIAVAEFDGAYLARDLQAYCHKYGRRMPTVTEVALSGSELLTLDGFQHMSEENQAAQLDASGEVMLDIEVVAGLCPGAAIDVYFAPFSEKGWVDLLNAVTAATPAPVVLTISWGRAEDSPDWSPGAVQEINQRLQAAAMLGITVYVSAGDDGASDGAQDGTYHVDFPASSPWVLAVGGTMLEGADQQEVAWWQTPGQRFVNGVPVGGGATGGGVSGVFGRPGWQDVKVASLRPDGFDGRVIPDVAAIAGPPGYDVFVLGQEIRVGGTSASTPLWAALLARIVSGLPAGEQRRFLTPLLYGNPSGGSPVGQVACHDITTGDNRSIGLTEGYQAGDGFDAVTGWGTPDGAVLRRLLF